jgi:hypothetical protein
MQSTLFPRLGERKMKYIPVNFSSFNIFKAIEIKDVIQEVPLKLSAK